MPRNKVLCIGNNTIDTDKQSFDIAKIRNITFRGGITSFNQVSADGCYHTSVSDMPDYEILQANDYFDEILFFDNYEKNSILESTSTVIKNILKNKNIDLKIIPKNHMLCVGCSHTAGVGHNTADTVFPTLAAKRLGRYPIISGHPGKGNQVIEDALAEYNLNSQHVIVQFTDVYRIRFFDSKLNTVVYKSGKDYTREEIAQLDDARLLWEYEQMVKRVVSKLRSSNAKFVFFQLSHSLNEETNRYMSNFKEFCYIPSNTIVDTASDGMHYGVQSQQNISELIIKRWNRLYAEN